MTDREREAWQSAFLMAFGAGFVVMWFVLPVGVSSIVSVIIGLRILYGMIYPRD
jgi:hypothetical protein